ncbi:MAG: flagellar hook-length control protein FliK [Methylobacter sp.]
MDINSPISPQSLLASSRLAENALNLKVGQQLDVKVINADIQAVKNAVTLSIGGKDVTVQSNQPLTLSSGQDLKVQVTQIAPVVEFKVLDQQNQTTELRLKLIPAVRNSGNALTGRESTQTTVREGGNISLGREPATRDGNGAPIGKESMLQTASAALAKPTTNAANPIMPPVPEKQGNTILTLQPAQLLDAKIANISGNKILLQLFNPSTAETGNKAVAQITIDRSQLTNAPSDLKIGQNLNLEIVKTGTAPEFKIIQTNSIPEAKVAEFIKQFLPKHEASPVLLNQLMKDLPQLMKNDSVSQTLKDIAAKIVQNLPPKEQLITSQGLKQAITHSGLFLEAKLPPSMSQAELIKELPQLIKNESVPQSLQRIAAEILQNLTQKQPLPTSSGLEQAMSKPAPETPPVSSTLNPQITTDSPSKADGLGDAGFIADDFKANLLKFIQALKQEIGQQSGELPLNQVDLDLLKNLQHKTENTVAKLVLDQLMSLPKDDSPKHLWIIDIPFIDRQQAESVRIEVQQDKESRQHNGNGDWSVNITISPPSLGTIHCILSYRNDVINTFFKSQNTQTTKLIKHNLDYLKNQLEQSGLKIGHMDAHDGAQKTQTAHPHPLAGKKLFDDKA